MEVNTNLISHTGTIKSIDYQHIIVKIISQTACSSCHAKGACSSADQTEKEIEVEQNEEIFSIGEKVLVLTTFSQGHKAVFYAYLLPLALLVCCLSLLLFLTKNEAIAALGALLFLFPYYLGLYLFRHKVKNSFHFTIQKQPIIPSNE